MRTIPDGFILPSFGGTAVKAAEPGTEPATSGGGYTGPRKLVLVCSKGNLDMAYPGLILANAAAGEGIEVHMFFTFWGLDMVNKKTMGNLQFTMVGNTAMHMHDLGGIKPGLEHWSMPQWMGRIPFMTKMATNMMNKQIADLGVPTVPEFLDLLEAAGVKMWACKMSFDMTKMIEADLHPAVQGVISATDFMDLSEGAQTLFI